MTERASLAQNAAREGLACRVRARHVGQRWREIPAIRPQSRASNPYYERIDPYWCGRLFSASRAWMSGSDPTSLSLSPTKNGPKESNHMNGADLVYRQQYQPNQDTAVETARALVDDVDNLRIVSVLRGVGPCLSSQLTALIGGEGPVYNNALAEAKALVAARVLEWHWSYHAGLPHPRAMVYRLHLGSSYFQWCRALFEAGMAKCVSAGAPLLIHGSDQTRHNSTRHQVLAIETMLRALELSEAWAGWMPESTCIPQSFLPHQHQMSNRPPNVASDNCLIRDDGLRVFIELTTGTNSRLDTQKIKSWSQMFEAGPFSAALLFVCSDHNTATQVASTIKTYATPKARERIFLATWEEYSPEHGIVTEDAQTMRAVRFTSSGWQAEHLTTVDLGHNDSTIVDRLQECLHIAPWISNSDQVVEQIAKAS